MNHGEMATHSPVSMPSAAAAWAPMPRQVAGSRYPSAAPVADGTAGTVSADAPLPSGRRIRGGFMTGSFLFFVRWAGGDFAAGRFCRGRGGGRGAPRAAGGGRAGGAGPAAAWGVLLGGPAVG